MLRDLSDTVCCPKTAAGAPPAGRLIGVKAWETAEYALSPERSDEHSASRH